MSLNVWNEAEVDRAENSWGQKIHPYTKDMFDFAIEGMSSWVDLGCGFGRFLNYLINSVDEPDYRGYDSSTDMCNRIKENFPAYSPRIFPKQINTPIRVDADSWICSAVLIHITLEDQQKVLNNILSNKPKKIAFDINSPSEHWLSNPENVHFERHIRGAQGAFRMTWQSHYEFTKKIIKMFSAYSLTVKFYSLNFKPVRYKVLYLLERK